MCTVTFYRSPQRILVTMNRDEKKTRGPERPPAIRRFEPTGINIIGPSDSDKGGTWIAVNSIGVVACLLNGYASSDSLRARKQELITRGRLVPGVLFQGSAKRGIEWLAKNNPNDYASFTMLVIDDQSAYRIDWSGAGALKIDPIYEQWRCVSSSSWNPDEVLPWRYEHFRMWLDTGQPYAGLLPTFHLLQPRGQKAHAPLMSRQESCTRSITQVSVIPAMTAEVNYWDFPVPKVREPSHSLRMAIDLQAHRAAAASYIQEGMEDTADQ